MRVGRNIGCCIWRVVVVCGNFSRGINLVFIVVGKLLKEFMGVMGVI